MTLGAFADVQTRKAPPPSSFFAKYEARGEIPDSALAVARIEAERLRKLGDDVGADALQVEIDRHTTVPLDSEEAFAERIETAKNEIATAASALRPDEGAVLKAQEALDALTRRRDAWRAIRSHDAERRSALGQAAARRRIADRESSRRAAKEAARVDARAEELAKHLVPLLVAMSERGLPSAPKHSREPVDVWRRAFAKAVEAGFSAAMVRGLLNEMTQLA